MIILIVLNYNDYVTTSKYIEMVKKYSVLDKIIVVDNCSTDNSYMFLKKFESQKVDIISTGKNNGYGSGNNFGIKYAESNYKPTTLIISNPDIEVSEKSILKLCNFLTLHKEVAAVSGLIYDKTNNIPDNFAWKLPQYSNLLISTFISISKLFEKTFNITLKYDKNSLNYIKEMYVDVLSGCFFAIKDSVVKEVDYFEERTFLYNEETILAYKLKEKGYKQCILSSEKIIHYHSVSINKSLKSWRKRNKILEKSRKVYLKHYLKVSKFKIFIFTIMFNVGKYEKFILLKLKQIYTKKKR